MTYRVAAFRSGFCLFRRASVDALLVGFELAVNVEGNLDGPVGHDLFLHPRHVPRDRHRVGALRLVVLGLGAVDAGVVGATGRSATLGPGDRVELGLAGFSALGVVHRACSANSSHQNPVRAVTRFGM